MPARCRPTFPTPASIGFEFTNEADDVNELYVLKANGDVVARSRTSPPAPAATLTVDLVAGDYLVRCKPGQTGDGFDSTSPSPVRAAPNRRLPDRTITFEAVDFRYPDLDVRRHRRGRHDPVRDDQRRRSQAHEFEVLDPDGNAIGEVAVDRAGRSRRRDHHLRVSRRLPLPVHPRRREHDEAAHRTRYGRLLRGSGELNSAGTSTEPHHIGYSDSDTATDATTRRHRCGDDCCLRHRRRTGGDGFGDHCCLRDRMADHADSSNSS